MDFYKLWPPWSATVAWRLAMVANAMYGLYRLELALSEPSWLYVLYMLLKIPIIVIALFRLFDGLDKLGRPGNQ